MDWDAIGAVGEVVGAAGVVASLLYLAVQVRGGARASAVDAKLRAAEMRIEFIDSLINTPELNDLWLRGLADLDSLSESEYYLFTNMSLKAFWLFSASHFQYSIGAVSESDWHESRVVMLYWLRRPGCQKWWQKIGRSSFDSDFQAYVDAEMAKILPEVRA